MGVNPGEVLHPEHILAGLGQFTQLGTRQFQLLCGMRRRLRQAPVFFLCQLVQALPEPQGPAQHQQRQGKNHPPGPHQLLCFIRMVLRQLGMERLHQRLQLGDAGRRVGHQPLLDHGVHAIGILVNTPGVQQTDAEDGHHQHQQRANGVAQAKGQYRCVHASAPSSANCDVFSGVAQLAGMHRVMRLP